jgi:hypothetical protein
MVEHTLAVVEFKRKAPFFGFRHRQQSNRVLRTHLPMTATFSRTIRSALVRLTFLVRQVMFASGPRHWQMKTLSLRSLKRLVHQLVSPVVSASDSQKKKKKTTYIMILIAELRKRGISSSSEL